jgi:hypothetical protein
MILVRTDHPCLKVGHHKGAEADVSQGRPWLCIIIFLSSLCKGIGMVMQSHRGTLTPFMSDALSYIFSLFLLCP